MRVGGAPDAYVEATSEQELIDSIRSADSAGIPVLVLGRGSNIVVADEGFSGLVVRDTRQGFTHVTAEPCGGAKFTVAAGQDWDDMVAYAIDQQWVGLEALSGIPGTVGAAPVQNIGAYGQEAAQTIASVRTWDRATNRKRTFAASELQFGYRMSILKQSMQAPWGTGGDDDGAGSGDGAGAGDDAGAGSGPGVASETGAGAGLGAAAQPVPGSPLWFPSPRFVVLDVTFQTKMGNLSAPIAYPELARTLGVDTGRRAPATAVREAVLAIRGAKGMLEDGRFGSPPGADHNRWSAGSFFTNPILTVADADLLLPKEAPRYPVRASGQARSSQGRSEPGQSGLDRSARRADVIDPTVVKTSAAWLIEHAGFKRGYGIDGADSAASLSTEHTLALTNRGGASTSDIAALARAVRGGVYASYGVLLEAEPVLVGWTI